MASAAIVVPCYNEESRLDVAAFRDFAQSSHKIGFLFVNDGSTDGTRYSLETLQAADPSKFRVLDLERNCGKAEACRRGILAAIESMPDYVGFWDADLATPLNAISEFIDVAENRPDIEIIVGSRVRLLGRRIERRPSRHYLGRVFATAVSVILALEIYDTQCGAKLFRISPSIRELFERPFLSRWIFDVEIIARLIHSRRGTTLREARQIIYEYPLMEWRDVPGSKLNSGDFLRATWELFHIWHRYFYNQPGRSTDRSLAPKNHYIN